MNDAEILQLRRVVWRRWMQKFCTTLFFAWFTTVPTTNGWCRNSASQFGGLKTVDAEILHDLFLRLILYLIYNKWIMQKLCISNRWLENCGCRNPAWPFFRLIDYLISISTTNEWCRNSASQFGGLKNADAEILHDLFSAKFATLSTTNEWCRNSASQISGLKNVDAEILHDLIFHFIYYLIYNKWMMQKFCISNPYRWLENCGCRNSAWLFFHLIHYDFYNKMNNAEILHLKSVAWKIWMQKICATFFSAYSCNLVLSRQQINDAEILHLN